MYDAMVPNYQRPCSGASARKGNLAGLGYHAEEVFRCSKRPQLPNAPSR
jgi:hypothetical protein